MGRDELIYVLAELACLQYVFSHQLIMNRIFLHPFGLERLIWVYLSTFFLMSFVWGKPMRLDFSLAKCNHSCNLIKAKLNEVSTYIAGWWEKKREEKGPIFQVEFTNKPNVDVYLFIFVLFFLVLYASELLRRWSITLCCHCVKCIYLFYFSERKLSQLKYVWTLDIAGQI